MFDRVAYMQAYNKAYRAKHAEELKLRKAAWSKKDRENHPQKARLKKIQWKEKNPEKFKASTAKYLKSNKDKIRARTKIWYEKNRERILTKGRAYHKKNRGKIQAYQTRRRREEPGFRLRDSLRHRVWTALKGVSKSASTADLVGCSIESLQAYLQEKFRPGMTWENYGPVWHLDHIKPCAKFNLIDPREQKRCFHWSNLQPLFKDENQRKGDRPWK